MGNGTKFRLKHRIDLKQQDPWDIAPLNRETKTRVGTTKAKYKDYMEEWAATVRDNLARESNTTSPAGNTVFLQDRGIAALFREMLHYN